MLCARTRARLAMCNDDPRPFSARVKLQADAVCIGKELLLRAFLARIDRRMDQAKPCRRSFSERLHVVQDACEIGRDGIPDLQNCDRLVLRLEQMLRQADEIAVPAPVP